MGWFEDKVLDPLSDIIQGAWESAIGIAEFLVTFDFSTLEAAIQTLFRDVYAAILKPIFAIIGIEDETVYSIDVITIPLLDTEAKYLKNTILTAALSNLDLPEELRFAIQTNQRATTRSALTYAKNHFIDGTPNAQVSEYFTDSEVIDVTLETIEGEAITASAIAFGIPNKDLWCKDYVMDNYSYVIETNILVKTSIDWYYDYAVINGGGTAFIVNLYRDTNTNVVIDDYTQVLLDPTEFTDTWTRTTTTVTHTPTDPGDPDVTVVDGTVTRNATSTGGPYITTFINISDIDTPSTVTTTLGEEITKYNSGGYYGVVYSVDSAPTVSKIWFYETALGSYPELNNSLIGGDEDGLDILPIVAIRQEYTNSDSDPLSARYLTTKRILDIIGIVSLDSLIEELDSNPNISLIQDAFFLFGVNLYTEDQYSLRYLFNFFMALSSLPKFDKTAFNALSVLDQSNSVFAFNVTEGRYNISLTGNYVEITEFTGYIGKIGFVETEITIIANTVATEADLALRGDLTDQDPTDSLGQPNSIFIIRTQLTDSSYTEVEIAGLSIVTNILTTGTDVGIKVVELVDPVTGADADKANFIIPLSYYALYRQAPIEVEQVIYDAAHLVIYAEDVTDLAYYQTSIFIKLVSAIIDIVSVILLFVSLGTSSAAQLTIKQILAIVAKQLAITFVLTFALKEALTHNLSNEEKLLLAVLFVFATKKGIELFDPEAFLLLADKLLLAVNAVSTFIETDTQVNTAKLLKEQSEFEELTKVRKDELKAAQEWLTPEGSIDTEGLLTSRAIPILDVSSTPDEFYTKSLMINIAPIILIQTSTYVSSVLDLDNISTGFNSAPATYTIDNVDIIL